MPIEQGYMMSASDPSKEINEKIITGKELQGKLLITIGTSDIKHYEKYLNDNEIKYSILTNASNEELSLLFLHTESKKRIFDELKKDNKDMTGDFMVLSIDNESKFRFVSGDEMELNVDNNLKEDFTEGNI